MENKTTPVRIYWKDLRYFRRTIKPRVNETMADYIHRIREKIEKINI